MFEIAKSLNYLVLKGVKHVTFPIHISVAAYQNQKTTKMDLDILVVPMLEPELSVVS